MSTYPKRGSDPSRTVRPKKRKFHGNQHSNKSDEAPAESATARKLTTADHEDVPVNLSHFYRVIEFISVFTAIQEIVICRTCKRGMKFEESGNRGLGFKIAVRCLCGIRFIQSGPLIRNGYEINKRIVFVMRLLGIGMQGINLFCSLMDIGKGLSKHAYDRVIQHVHKVTKNNFDQMSVRVAKQERKENEERHLPSDNFKVSDDGFWKKRGFTSLFGVTTLIAY